MLNLSDPADGVGLAGCLHAARRKEGETFSAFSSPPDEEIAASERARRGEETHVNNERVLTPLATAVCLTLD